MKIKIIKGTNQIGGCITEITSNSGKKIIIDYGCDLNNENTMSPEIDWSNVTDVFITHNHDDHIRYINYIPKDIKVHVERISFGIYKILNDFMLNKEEMRNVELFNIGDEISAGDIKVKSYVVDHSSFNSVMFLVECDNKKLLHMGDFRSNGKKGSLLFKTLKTIGEVDVLIMEGTTITRVDNKKNKTENELQKYIEEIIKNYDQVLIMQSSTNIDRIITMYKASIRTGKIFLEDICTVNICSYLEKCGYDKIPNIKFRNVYSFLPFKRREDYNNPSDFYKEYIIPFNKKDGHSKINVPYSLMIKTSMFPDIKKRYNDGFLNKACLIYSMWSGYLKDEAMDKFIKQIKSLGVDVYECHTSGHADEDTRARVLKTIKYKYLIPIHTEDKEKYSDYKNAVILKDNETFKVE